MLAYAYPWNDLIARWKFRADVGMTGSLAAMALRDTKTIALVQGAHWVIPMPLFKARLQARGYNQSALLAQAICSGLHLPRLNTQLLLRVRDTPEQVGLSRTERLLNMQGAFALEPALTADDFANFPDYLNQPNFHAPSASHCKRPIRTRETQANLQAGPNEHLKSKADGDVLRRHSPVMSLAAPAPAAKPSPQASITAVAPVQQSQVITAGVVDDNADFGEYLAFRNAGVRNPAELLIRRNHHWITGSSTIERLEN